MIAFFYQWLQNIAFYLILITAIIQIIPNHSYKKYIRFFTGLILIVNKAVLNTVLNVLKDKKGDKIK